MQVLYVTQDVYGVVKGVVAILALDSSYAGGRNTWEFDQDKLLRACRFLPREGIPGRVDRALEAPPPAV